MQTRRQARESRPHCLTSQDTRGDREKREAQLGWVRQAQSTRPGRVPAADPGRTPLDGLDTEVGVVGRIPLWPNSAALDVSAPPNPELEADLLLSCACACARAWP